MRRVKDDPDIKIYGVGFRLVSWEEFDWFIQYGGQRGVPFVDYVRTHARLSVMLRSRPEREGSRLVTYPYQPTADEMSLFTPVQVDPNPDT